MTISNFVELLVLGSALWLGFRHHARRNHARWLARSREEARIARALEAGGAHRYPHTMH